VALNPNNTARYFLDYSIAAGEARTLQVRYAAPASPADVASWLEVFLTILEPILCADWAITGARVAAAGSNITLPSSAPSAVTPAGGALSAYQRPLFNAVQGRDVLSGSKHRLSFYGITNGVPADYRWQRGESSLYDDLLDMVQVPVVGVNLSIAGNQTQWYDYINVGFNSYHERKQRG